MTNKNSGFTSLPVPIWQGLHINLLEGKYQVLITNNHY